MHNQESVTWADSYEFASRARQSYLLRGDVMFTRLYSDTPWALVKLMNREILGPPFPQYLLDQSEDLIGRELVKQLSGITSGSYCCHDVIRHEFLRRCEANPPSSNTPGDRLSRDGLSVATVQDLARGDGMTEKTLLDVTRRAWLVKKYVRDCHNSQQPHIVRTLSDERLLDVMLWRMLIAAEDPEDSVESHLWAIVDPEKEEVSA